MLAGCLIFLTFTLRLLMSLLTFGSFSCPFKSIIQCDASSSAIGVLVYKHVAKPLAGDVGCSDYDVIMLFIGIVMTSHDIRAFRYIVSTL